MIRGAEVHPDLNFSLMGRKRLTGRDCCFIARHMSNYRKIDAQRFAEMFKALSNPHRLSIFLSLVECCPRAERTVSADEARRYVGELGEKLDIAPSTVSHHIKELRQAGLIRVERRGKNILCWADEDALRAMVEILGGHVSRSLEG